MVDDGVEEERQEGKGRGGANGLCSVVRSLGGWEKRKGEFLGSVGFPGTDTSHSRSPRGTTDNHLAWALINL